jgi:hypothetical protein
VKAGWGKLKDAEVFNRVADHLMLRSGSKVNVKIEARFPGNRLVGGKYHMATHTVYLYKEEIREQCILLFGSLERLEEYIAVVFAHELGHAEDTQLEQLTTWLDESFTVRDRAETKLRIEENAWDYAEILLADMDSEFIDIIINESLAGYRNELQLDIA